VIAEKKPPIHAAAAAALHKEWATSKGHGWVN